MTTKRHGTARRRVRTVVEGERSPAERFEVAPPRANDPWACTWSELEGWAQRTDRARFSRT